MSVERRVQQPLSSSRIIRAEGTTLRTAPLVESRAVGYIYPVAEPCSSVARPGAPVRRSISRPRAEAPMAAVTYDIHCDGHADMLVTGAAPLMESRTSGYRCPVAEPCSSVARSGTPVQRSISRTGAEVPMAAVAYDINRDGHADIIVTGTDINHDGIPDMMQRSASSSLQGNMTNTPFAHQTCCPNVYQDGLTSQFHAAAPVHASPHPLQPCVLAAGAKTFSVGASTPRVMEDGCGSNDRCQGIQRRPLAQQPTLTAALTVRSQAGQDYLEHQHRELACTDESQLFLLEHLTDIGKSLDVINKASATSEERCSKSESAITEVRTSIQDLRRDMDVLQSQFLATSQVPALDSIHNDMETLRTEHLYALNAIEEQHQEHNQLHTMYGELRQLLTELGQGLQELNVQSETSMISNMQQQQATKLQELEAQVAKHNRDMEETPAQSETSLISNMQQQQASKLQELEAQVAKHIRDMEQTPALQADQHRRFQARDSFLAEAEWQEQTRALEELTNYVQETRQEIFSTVDSALDEVRLEIKALSEQPNTSIPHQVSTVNGINSGIMTVGEPAIASGVHGGSLRISILGASGLRNADWAPGTGKSDPYCTCEILAKPDAAKIRTHVIKNNLHPTWDYEAELTEFEAGDILVFKVYDADVGKNDDFLGTLSLMSEQFYPHGFEGVLPLQEAGKGITANLRLRIPPATVVNPMPAVQPLVEAPIQRWAVFGQEDAAVSELQEQLGCLKEAVRNEFNGLHESFDVNSRRMQGTEIAPGGPDVVQLAANLESEMAKRVESEALLQHELANVVLRVEQLLDHETLDVDGPRPELPVVQLALTKAEQSLVASSNLQDGVQEMQQEFLKLAQQQTRLEGRLAGLEDLRTKVDIMRAELDSPLEKY